MNGFKANKTQSFGLWKKEIVLIANVLPAILSFFLNLLAIMQLGVAGFGKWMIWRSSCQLTANINPGFSQSLILFLPKLSYSKINKASVIKTSYWSSLGWAVMSGLLFSMIAYLGFNVKGVELIVLIIYWEGIAFVGFTGNLARGLEDGKGLLIGAAGNALGSVFCLAILIASPNWSYFVLANALALWLQGLGQYIFNVEARRSFQIPFSKYRVRLRRSVRVGFPLVIRGWTQTAAQYGDRIVIGFFFGAAATGAAGIGSTLALPLVMASSSLMSWALPLLISKKISLELIPRYLKTLMIIGIAGIIILPILKPILFKPSMESLDTLKLAAMGYYITALIGISNLLLLPLMVNRRVWQVAFLQLILILCFWGGIIMGYLIGDSLFLGLVINSYFLTYILLFFYKKQNKISNSKAFLGVLLPLLISTYCKNIEYFCSISYIPWLMASVGLILVCKAAWLFLFERGSAWSTQR
ncbi:hypothetical protein [Legionella brunensis]|uniref:hypothetical protein n=1 Tax=Legionella brunensis TaxID=29422 RepID=UPI00104162FE|nr:hypothetical protein [Legionella brunensis]